MEIGQENKVATNKNMKYLDLYPSSLLFQRWFKPQIWTETIEPEFWELKMRHDFPNECNRNKFISDIHPIHERAYLKYLELFSEKNVSFGSERFKSLNRCLFDSIKRRSDTLVNYFIEKGADDYVSALIKSVKYGNSKFIEYFWKKISKDICLNRTDIYRLIVNAGKGGHFASIRYVQKFSNNPNYYNWLAYGAAKGNHSKLLKSIQLHVDNWIPVIEIGLERNLCSIIQAVSSLPNGLEMIKEVINNNGLKNNDYREYIYAKRIIARSWVMVKIDPNIRLSTPVLLACVNRGSLSAFDEILSRNPCYITDDIKSKLVFEARRKGYIGLASLIRDL